MQRRGSQRIWMMLVFLFLLPPACSGREDNPLIGKWEHKESVSGVTVTLEFTRNKLSFSAAGVTPASTSYTYIDEHTIKVRNLDTGFDVETSFVIQGDTLTIAFIGEEKVVYTRVK